MLTYSIRQATQEDSEAIARLTTELGYPVPAYKMGTRLRNLLTNRSDLVLVAETSGVVVGWVHGTLSQFLEADYRVEIGGLIVDEKFRSHGIGRTLLAGVEAWATKHGALHATVRCRDTRPKAHRFYQQLGYGRTKTQIVFRKALPTEKRDY